MSDSEGEEDGDRKDMDEDGRKMNQVLQGKPAEDVKKEQISDDEEEEAKKPAEVPQAKKGKKEVLGSVKIKLKAPEVKQEPGTKRSAASGASDTIPAAKRAKTASAAAGAGAAGTSAAAGASAAAAGAAAPAAASKITAEDVRNVIKKDPEMTMKKLVAVFNANKFAGDVKAAFLSVVKEAAMLTKRKVAEGPYKDQMIVTVKPAAKPS